MPSRTPIQHPFACPTCFNLSTIYGGRFNVSENITVRYRTCAYCQKQFVTDIQPDNSETFRHWVQPGKGGRRKEEGGLWAGKRECLKMLLRAIYYELYCQVKLGDDEGITEKTRELVKLCIS